MENILLKGFLYGLFIYGSLLIFYVEFRDRKHTTYQSEVETVSSGLLLILAVILNVPLHPLINKANLDFLLSKPLFASIKTIVEGDA